MSAPDKEEKSIGDTLREALSLDAPAYPARAEPKREEKEQASEPQEEFRDLESNKSQTTTPEPDVGPRT